MSNQEQDQRHHVGIDALNAYLDDTLSSAERLRIDEHLKTCPVCRDELAELRAVVDILHQLPQYDPPTSFQLGPEHARASGAPSATIVRFLPIVRALSVAAILAFMIASGFLLINRPGTDNQTSDQGAPMAMEAAPTSVVASNNGGTGGARQASNYAEAEPTAQSQTRRSILPSSAANSSGQLIDRGDSASANGAAPGDAEAEASTPQSSIGQGAPLTTEPVDSSTGTSGNQWLITSIGLGVLVVLLVGLWILLTRMSRQRRAG